MIIEEMYSSVPLEKRRDLACLVGNFAPITNIGILAATLGTLKKFRRSHYAILLLDDYFHEK